MRFIELTQIKKSPSGVTGMESFIVGKISISSDSIISFEESIDLFLPEEINSNSDKQPTKVTLSTGMSFIVAESYEYILSQIS